MHFGLKNYTSAVLFFGVLHVTLLASNTIHWTCRIIHQTFLDPDICWNDVQFCVFCSLKCKLKSQTLKQEHLTCADACWPYAVLLHTRSYNIFNKCKFWQNKLNVRTKLAYLKQFSAFVRNHFSASAVTTLWLYTIIIIIIRLCIVNYSCFFHLNQVDPVPYLDTSDAARARIVQLVI